MSEKVFDRETLLDLVVNVIPFVVLVAFFATFLLFSPFGGGSVITTIQLSIIGVAALGLLILTYYSGAAISKAEMDAEAELEGEAGDGPAELKAGESDDE